MYHTISFGGQRQHIKRPDAVLSVMPPLVTCESAGLMLPLVTCDSVGGLMFIIMLLLVTVLVQGA